MPEVTPTSTPASGTASRSGRGAARAASRCCACSLATSTPTTMSASRCTTPIRTSLATASAYGSARVSIAWTARSPRIRRTTAGRSRGAERRVLLWSARRRQWPVDVMAAGDTQHDTNTCGTTRCDDPYPAYPNIGMDDTHPFGSDPNSPNWPCGPFTYRSGITSSFCYGENDPDRAQSDQQCGDHWTYPLRLTTDWQLFLALFDLDVRAGLREAFHVLDLKSVSVARFTWDAARSFLHRQLAVLPG